MLSKDAQKKLLKHLKFSDADIAKAVDSDTDAEIAIPETLQIFTPEELTTRDTNLTADAKKEGQKIGESIGKEIPVKDLKKIFGIEFEGKDLTKLAEAIKAQLAKGDAGLQEQVRLLQQQVTDKDLAIATEKSNAQAAMFDATLLSALPQNRKSVEKGGFTDQEYLAAIKSNLKFEHTDGGVIVKKGDQAFRDPKTTNPLPIPAVLKTYMEERKWTDAVGGTGGRGGGNDGGGGSSGAKKMSQVQADWLQANPQGNLISPEFTAHVGEIMKNTPDFKPYE